ncbi:LLM class flavin-dependent oxidoreductase [Actinomadura fulvescens]|uniref:LLM class flavin-dependent oxidoreductase n=1 Tax=Actinomadura fulvescens TaxID=46160 RepID=UPI0031D0A21A
MRFGIFLLATRYPGQTDADALARTVEAALTAERAGFDDVWIAEHHFMSYGVCPSAPTLAGVLLGRTSRIHVGTAISILSSQHPVMLAEQAALLSLVSGGRFHLGVGRGGPWRELEVFGTGLPRYEKGFAESLDLLLAWLRSDRLGWSGEHFEFREVPVVPRTATPPPVAVACASPATEALAAARDLPMLLGMHVGNADKAEAVARHGRPAPHISTHLAQVADSRAEAVETILRRMPPWLGPGLDSYVAVDDRPRPKRDPVAYVRHLCELQHPIGSPDDCAEALLATAEHTGIQHMIMHVEAGGSRTATLDNIARLGSEVIPKVRAAQPTSGYG